MVRLLAKLIAITIFGACAPSILPLYEQTFQETLATAPPVPKNWRPDASLQLSNALLQNTVRSMIATSGILTKASTVDGPLGITAKISPNLRLQDLKIGSSEACARCATVKATVEGNVRWSMGSQGTRLPVAGHLDFVLKVQPKEGKKRWSVTLKPHQINSASLQLATMATTTRGKDLELGSFSRKAAELFLPRIPAEFRLHCIMHCAEQIIHRLCTLTGSWCSGARIAHQ